MKGILLEQMFVCGCIRGKMSASFPSPPDLLISDTLCLIDELSALFWCWNCETQHQITMVLP